MEMRGLGHSKKRKKKVVLHVDGYRGGTYPTWINMLQQIVKLTLSDCHNLKELPPLWQLPALQVLSLKGLKSLNCLCSGDAVTPFNELKELSLSYMANFETWWVNEVLGEESIFPQVEKLSICKCKSLSALPKASIIKEPSGGVIKTVWRSAFPALKELELDDLPAFQRWEAVQGEEVKFPRLEKQITSLCPELTSLPEAPNLRELEIHGCSQQMLIQVANCIVTASSLSKLDLWNYVDREATLIQLVDGEEKQNQNKSPSPLTVMELHGCNVFFSHSRLWACLVQLEDLKIKECDALVHWPEEVFQSLVSLRKLEILECKNLTGRRLASSEQSRPEWSSVLLPRLESLDIKWCAHLEEVPTSVLPASLKSLTILYCHKLEAIAFSKQSAMLASAQGVAAAHSEDGKSALIAGSCSDTTASTPVPKLSSSTKHHFLPCLESLEISGCDGLLEVLDLPPSIKTLKIDRCSNLQALSGHLDAVQKLRIEYCSSLKSLESLLGELALLEELYLSRCKSLVSLPNEPQAYSSLRRLSIKSCPGIKLLPRSLQQRLGDLKDEDNELDGHYYQDLNSWKYAIKRHFCA